MYEQREIAVAHARVLTGYCLGSTTSPKQANGDFVVGVDRPGDGYAVSSTVGAFPWYYTVVDGALHQSDNVFELCRRTRQQWLWNREAVSQIALIGHTLGAHTLHRNIFRLRAGAGLTLERGEAALASCYEAPASWTWDSDDPDAACAALRTAFEDCIDGGESVLLSLSAGYDSRLLLALCLAAGVLPTLRVMGPKDCTDVLGACHIAGQCGVPIERVEIDPDGFLVHGQAISYATSGVKTAADWHTWIYAREIGSANALHLVGSNGEFARTFYSDAVTRSSAFRRFGRGAVRSYFVLRALRRLLKYPRRAQILSLGDVRSVAATISLGERFYPPSLLPCLDTFYAFERVRHFIGAGLACYAAFGRPRSPFLDRRWMQSVAATRRVWKEGSRYHVEAMRRFWPRLAETPFNADVTNGRLRAYSPFAAVADRKDVRELLIESRELDTFVERRAREAGLADASGDHAAFVSLLLTLHYAAVNARDAASGAAVGRATPTT